MRLPLLVFVLYLVLLVLSLLPERMSNTNRRDETRASRKQTGAYSNEAGAYSNEAGNSGFKAVKIESNSQLGIRKSKPPYRNQEIHYKRQALKPEEIKNSPQQ